MSKVFTVVVCEVFEKHHGVREYYGRPHAKPFVLKEGQDKREVALQITNYIAECYAEERVLDAQSYAWTMREVIETQNKHRDRFYNLQKMKQLRDDLSNEPLTGLGTCRLCLGRVRIDHKVFDFSIQHDVNLVINTAPNGIQTDTVRSETK